MNKTLKQLWLGLGILALLSPLGLYLPEKLKAVEGAWGEWSPEEILIQTGLMPEGLNKLSNLWRAPVADYNFGSEGASLLHLSFSYIASALLGITLTALVVFLISRLWVRHDFET